MDAKEKSQSEYYRAIAREFLGRRGAPFFLSPRDLSLIADWEKMGVPLDAVLEGIGRAFDGRKNKARGTKGLGLDFCRGQVDGALAQRREREAGRPAKAVPRRTKRDRARREVERILPTLSAEDPDLAPAFEAAFQELSSPGPDEDILEKIDEGVDDVLWRRAPDGEREAVRRQARRELAGSPAGEVEAIIRRRLAKAARDRGRIPYVSLYYY